MLAAVDCQQLERTGARSAGCSAACNDFIPTACVRNMRTWGGLACLFGRGRREAATDRMARIWEEHDSAEHHCTPGRTNPSSFTTAAPGPARAHGENSKQGRTIWPAESEWGPHDRSVLNPTAVHRDKRTTSWHAGPFAGGLRGTGRGSTYVEAQHRAANGQPKVNGGHATGAC